MIRRFRFDTETHVIEPGIPAPEMVCLQYAYDDDPVRIVLARDAFDVLVTALQDPNVVFVAHNGAFDWAVICARFPSLVPLVWRALASGRGRDTLIRETLKTIKDGTLRIAGKQKGYFKLSSLAARYLHKEVLKGEDSWQLRYGELHEIPVEQWPPEAVAYCHEDIELLRELEATEELNPDPHIAGYDYPDEWMQVLAAFALHLAAVWGVRVNPERLAAAEANLEAEQVGLKKRLEESGLMIDDVVKVDVARSLIVEACKKRGIDPPRTKPSSRSPTGQVKTDGETIELFDDVPQLVDMVDYKANEKVLSTYLLPMRAGTQRAMNSRPNVLVASGRTSWGGTLIDGIREGTNLQNFPRKGKIRDCIMPRPGYVWLGVDYASLELHTLGQVCKWICDKSVLADGFKRDKNWDPLTEFGAKLARFSVADALAIMRGEHGPAEKKRFKEGPRQNAKAALYGFPGGMGAKKFVDTAKKQYGLILTIRDAYKLKDEWLVFLPEMNGYFDYVNYVVNSGEARQFVSGRIRGGIGFCDLANTWFQGLAADGAKMAFAAASMECYAVPDSPLFGSRPVAFVHDEGDFEVPIERAHEAAMRCVYLFEHYMDKVTPDAPNRAVPALSSAWIKEAEEKFDPEGRLVLWG